MSGVERLTGYAELAEVLDNLPLLIREARRARGLSLRGAAKDMGLSFSTVTRMEHGGDCVLTNARVVLRWLEATTPAPTPGAHDTEPKEAP